VSEVGIDLGGVEVPVVGVPTATLTGWNLVALPTLTASSASSTACSCLPVTRSKPAAGDPRPPSGAVQESQGYVRAVERFVRRSVKERFLLPDDADAAVATPRQRRSRRRRPLTSDQSSSNSIDSKDLAGQLAFGEKSGAVHGLPGGPAQERGPGGKP